MQGRSKSPGRFKLFSNRRDQGTSAEMRPSSSEPVSESSNASHKLDSGSGRKSPFRMMARANKLVKSLSKTIKEVGHAQRSRKGNDRGHGSSLVDDPRPSFDRAQPSLRSIGINTTPPPSPRGDSPRSRLSGGRISAGRLSSGKSRTSASPTSSAISESPRTHTLNAVRTTSNKTVGTNPADIDVLTQNVARSPSRKGQDPHRQSRGTVSAASITRRVTGDFSHHPKVIEVKPPAPIRLSVEISRNHDSTLQASTAPGEFSPSGQRTQTKNQKNIHASKPASTFAPTSAAFQLREPAAPSDLTNPGSTLSDTRQQRDALGTTATAASTTAAATAPRSESQHGLELQNEYISLATNSVALQPRFPVLGWKHPENLRVPNLGSPQKKPPQPTPAEKTFGFVPSNPPPLPSPPTTESISAPQPEEYEPSDSTHPHNPRTSRDSVLALKQMSKTTAIKSQFQHEGAKLCGRAQPAPQHPPTSPAPKAPVHSQSFKSPPPPSPLGAPRPVAAPHSTSSPALTAQPPSLVSKTAPEPQRPTPDGMGARPASNAPTTATNTAARSPKPRINQPRPAPQPSLAPYRPAASPAQEIAAPVLTAVVAPAPRHPVAPSNTVHAAATSTRESASFRAAQSGGVQDKIKKINQQEPTTVASIEEEVDNSEDRMPNVSPSRPRTTRSDTVTPSSQRRRSSSLPSRLSSGMQAEVDNDHDVFPMVAVVPSPNKPTSPLAPPSYRAVDQGPIHIVVPPFATAQRKPHSSPAFDPRPAPYVVVPPSLMAANLTHHTGADEPRFPARINAGGTVASVQGVRRSMLFYEHRRVSNVQPSPEDNDRVMHGRETNSGLSVTPERTGYHGSSPGGNRVSCSGSEASESESEGHDSVMCPREEGEDEWEGNYLSCDTLGGRAPSGAPSFSDYPERPTLSSVRTTQVHRDTDNSVGRARDSNGTTVVHGRESALGDGYNSHTSHYAAAILSAATAANPVRRPEAPFVRAPHPSTATLPPSTLSSVLEVPTDAPPGRRPAIFPAPYAIPEPPCSCCRPDVVSTGAFNAAPAAIAEEIDEFVPFAGLAYRTEIVERRKVLNWAKFFDRKRDADE